MQVISDVVETEACLKIMEQMREGSLVPTVYLYLPPLGCDLYMW